MELRNQAQTSSIIQAKIVIRTSIEETLIESRASAAVTENSPAKGHSSDDARSWLQPAVEEANKKTKEAIDRLKLASNEREAMKDIKDFDSFTEFVNRLETTRHNAKSASVSNAIQRNIAGFKSFADSYAEIIKTVSDAVPFGAGSLCWGLCSVVMTVVSKKLEREQAMREALSRVSQTLPRLREYGILYPKSKRMAERLVELHVKIVDFLCEVLLYCRGRGTKHAMSRYFRALSPNDRIASLVGEINIISRDIFHEGLIELSAEVRRITESAKNAERNTSEMRKQFEDAKAKLEEANRKLAEASRERAELKKQITDAEDTRIRNDLERIKCHFVAEAYDPEKVFSHTEKQILQSSSLTESRRLTYGQALDRDQLALWLNPKHGLRACDSNFKQIIWVTSQKQRDSNAISHITLMVLERLLKDRRAMLPQLSSRNGLQDSPDGSSLRPLVIYSPYQEGLSTTTLSDNARTGCTLFQEAIFQLILHDPHLIRDNKTLQKICQKVHGGSSDHSHEIIDLKSLAGLLGDLIRAVMKKHGTNSNSAKKEDISESLPPIYWIIDRIDKVEWRRAGTPHKRQSKLPANRVSQLSEFATAVEGIIHDRASRPVSRMKEEMSQAININSSPLRILITSPYTPYDLDETWPNKNTNDDDGDYYVDDNVHYFGNGRDGDNTTGLGFSRSGWGELSI
ncbi:hypothetical protein VTN77DRAFT_3426 [Rasamsonia byssochlamydoides]|uniref:uncharacterized protein n=1 Tax=Rasamsonia byssochlamydoides TaxID=89139 RepID=UPI0037434514